MTYPVISKHFRYFFQFLQIQFEETYFFQEAIVIFSLRDWTCKQKYKWKIFIFCPFSWYFTYSSIFNLFHIFFQFLPLQAEKKLSSRKPWQFPRSNEHVNSNTTVRYWYSAYFCCCLISLENCNFIHFQTFLTFKSVSSTPSGRNLFLPGSHHSFWFHFPYGRNM